MSESETINSLIVVAGAPVALDINKDYYLVDSNSTGSNRVWRTNATQRIFFAPDYGWVIADFTAAVETDDFHFDGYTIYFFSGCEPAYTGVTGDTNPWEVTTWYTHIKSLEPYAEVLNLTHREDPEIVTTEETVKDFQYTVTADKKFELSKTYYTLTGLDAHPYASVSQIVDGQAVPEHSYFELIDDQYVLTTDTVFKANKVYYTRIYAGLDEHPYIYTAAVRTGTTVPASLYYEATGEVTRIITTTTNNRTGETNVSTRETVTTSATVINEHKRYSIPELQTGNIYRFSFVGDFNKLGYNNPNSDDYVDGETPDADITKGVYKLAATTTYYDLVIGGVDVFQNLYLPLGISREVYNLDKRQWKKSDIWYKLVDPIQDSIVYYVPVSIISGIPDGNVSEYKRYQLVIDIGIFNDPELLTEIITCVNMLFKAHFGIPTSANLAAYDSVWLPNEFYDWLENERKNNIVEFMSVNSAQYFNTLFYNKYNQLAKENAKLNASVKTYEEIVTGLAPGK